MGKEITMTDYRMTSMIFLNKEMLKTEAFELEMYSSGDHQSRSESQCALQSHFGLAGFGFSI